MTNSYSWAQNIKLHKQRNRRWRYLLKAGGFWTQQNLSRTWSNREPQTMPIIIAAVLSCGYIHPSSSARRILQDFPFEWEIDGDLSSLFLIHPPTRFCHVNTNHAASVSSGPPFLLPWLLWDTKLSSVLSGSPDHGEMERCQLLTIPRISVWPLVPDRQCGGSLSDILKWPFCLRKHCFKSSV